MTTNPDPVGESVRLAVQRCGVHAQVGWLHHDRTIHQGAWCLHLGCVPLCVPIAEAKDFATDTDFTGGVYGPLVGGEGGSTDPVQVNINGHPSTTERAQ